MTRVSLRVRDNKSRRVTLSVEYDNKAAQIEVPIPTPLYDDEPAFAAYGRELRSLLDALEVWAIRQGQVLV